MLFLKHLLKCLNDWMHMVVNLSVCFLYNALKNHFAFQFKRKPKKS